MRAHVWKKEKTRTPNTRRGDRTVTNERTMHASGSKSTVAMPYAAVPTMLEAPVRTKVVDAE